MRRMLLLTSLIVIVSSLTFMICDVSAQSRNLKIVSVLSAVSTPYDKPLRVDVVVAHDVTALPSVAVYYIPLLNGTLPTGVWRVVAAQLAYSVSGFNTSMFSAAVPSPVYQDSLPWNTKIVFYAEARDTFGNSALSCREKDRWNAYVQDDKYTFVLKDPYPPEISNIEQYPKTPTSEDSVAVTAKVSKASTGSGISKVSLIYSLDEGKTWTSVVMSSSETQVYDGSVPAQKMGSSVAYYVEAYDNAGNKRKSAQMNYQVLPSPEELRQEQFRQWQIWMIVAGVMAVVAIAGALGYRRKLAKTAKDIRRMRHKALAFTALVTLLLVGWTSQSLYKEHKWLALITFLAVLEFWGVVDRRLRSVLVGSMIEPAREIASSIMNYLTRTFEENPPTLLVATCYVVAFVGAVMVGGLYIGGAFTIREAYHVANSFATLVFFLLAAAAIGQLLWVVYKGGEEKAG